MREMDKIQIKNKAVDLFKMELRRNPDDLYSDPRPSQHILAIGLKAVEYLEPAQIAYAIKVTAVASTSAPHEVYPISDIQTLYKRSPDIIRDVSHYDSNLFEGVIISEMPVDALKLLLEYMSRVCKDLSPVILMGTFKKTELTKIAKNYGIAGLKLFPETDLYQGFIRKAKS